MSNSLHKIVHKYQSKFKYLIKYIILLEPIYRKLLFLFLDITAIISSFFLINALNYNEITFNAKQIILITLVISITYIFSGHYSSLSRYESSKDIYTLALKNIIVTVGLNIYSKFFSLDIFNLKVSLNFWLLTTISIGSIRIISRDLIALSLKNDDELSQNFQNIAIFGTDSESIKLSDSLKNLGNYKVRFFIDGAKYLNGYSIKGIKIKDPYNLSLEDKIDSIFIFSNKIENENIDQILNYARNFNIDIIKIPDIKKLTSGELKIQELKPLIIEDLLFREKVTINYAKEKKYFKGKSICIIGAGGSIGSEISNQIKNYEPKKIILFDISEINLYKINQSLSNSNNENIEIVPILGDSCDSKYLLKVFSDYQIDTIFHTAAYKHVPIVEKNSLQGIYNNVFTTLAICEAAEKLNIEKVITISTDKAVRPTNIMGASKRVSELVVQAYADRKIENCNTIYSMVRFGNVLTSSGSVVPLFKKQIKEGGPITITHPEITRYFMTITEAALLVLETSIMSEGGEIYLLDMGKPVKIMELAIQMIKKSGLILKDENNKNGNIEIRSTGLRPGEKLYEELLISADAEPTNHHKIFKAREEFIPNHILFPKLNNLKDFIMKRDIKNSLQIIKDLVPEWEISDELKNDMENSL